MIHGKFETYIFPYLYHKFVCSLTVVYDLYAQTLFCFSHISCLRRLFAIKCCPCFCHVLFLQYNINTVQYNVSKQISGLNIDGTPQCRVLNFYMAKCHQELE